MNKVFEWKYLILVVAACIYVLTAINSSGYHHPDEHFQLIEFAGLKAGWNQGGDLAWEYDARIRPALQPVLALGLIKICQACEISDPFLIATFLRLITACFSFLCIYLFMQSYSHSVRPEYRAAFFFTSFLLWFLPAINVRFSSETWAGCFMLLSFYHLHKTQIHRDLDLLVMGLLLGVCIEFRFQMALAVVGLFLWILLIKKSRLKQFMRYHIPSGNDSFMDAILYWQCGYDETRNTYFIKTTKRIQDVQYSFVFYESTILQL